MKTLDQFFPKVTNTLPEGCYILCTDDNTDMYFAKYESGSLCYWDLDSGNHDEYYFSSDVVTEEDMASALYDVFGTYNLSCYYIATEEEVGNMILAYYGLNVRCVANNARKGRVVKKSTKKAK